MRSLSLDTEGHLVEADRLDEVQVSTTFPSCSTMFITSPWRSRGVLHACERLTRWLGRRVTCHMSTSTPTSHLTWARLLSRARQESTASRPAQSARRDKPDE